MIRKIIDFSIDHRVLVLIFSALLVGIGIWATPRLTVDALPDLSDVQVVVRTSFHGQSPQVIEDQITQPLATAMLAVPHARDVRGYSMFGDSFLYILFDEGTDLYWARARVLEQLSTLTDRLPAGVSPSLGPDATGVGWIYQYVLSTSLYSPAYPNGFWHDTHQNLWIPATAANAAAYLDRPGFVRVRTFAADGSTTTCPLSGEPLQPADISLDELRSLQDYYLRYGLTPLEGVSEVATAGGSKKQYQVTVDPIQLQNYRLTLPQIADLIRRSNIELGGASLELAETEIRIQGIGYLGRNAVAADPTDPMHAIETNRNITAKVVQDLEQIPLATDDGEVLRLGEVARISTGTQFRQGIVDWNGRGETTGAIIVMRHGENARATIERVKHRLHELETGLPPGVSIEPAYDRSDLIDRSIQTLSHTLIKEMAVVALVVLLFLLHLRSSLVAVIVLPTAVLISLSLMYLLGINANIMSLGGLAIAIGVMVDCSIIMVENAHQKLEECRHRKGREYAAQHRVALITEAAREVGPTLFFSLLVISLSFLPVFLLGDQAGKLFTPLAFTKTFAMGAASILAITLIPALMIYLIRESVLPATLSRYQRIVTTAVLIFLPPLLTVLLPLSDGVRWLLALSWLLLSAIILLPQRFTDENSNVLNRILEPTYSSALNLAIRWRPLLFIGTVLFVAITFLLPFRQLGTEFMPPLEEGDLLYMPTTTEPSIGIGKAAELLEQTNRLIMQFPEVQSVKGKIGRADTATDPAPLNMIESTIVLHRDQSQWRHLPVARFHTDWPQWLRWLPERLWPSSRPVHIDELVYGFTLADGTFVPGLDSVLQIPGLANSWTMPIRARLDMLSTGIRTPVGIKIMGPDIDSLNTIARQVEESIKTHPATAAHVTSAYTEKTTGGYDLEIIPDRQLLARYGISMDVVQSLIDQALGGSAVTTTVEGTQRYPVNLRYPIDWRDSPESIGRALIPLSDDTVIPLAEVARIRLREGPAMLKSENAQPTVWVYVDIAGRDIGQFVRDAQTAIAQNVTLPAGYSLNWSGQFEQMLKAKQQFSVAIPLTLAGIALLLYLSTRSWLRVILIFVTLSFSISGAIWLLWLLDYNLSVAVLVGMIALLGLDAETSLIMLLYLDNSYNRFARQGRTGNRQGLYQSVYHGAVRRLRPKTMTVLTTIIGLLPLMFASGAGADTMRRLAAPMVGGLITSFLLELLLYPALYLTAREWQLHRKRSKSTTHNKSDTHDHTVP